MPRKQKKKYDPIISGTHDVPTMVFLWNIKASSLDAIALRFFDGKLRSAYDRLSKLRTAGYVQCEPSFDGQSLKKVSGTFMNYWTYSYRNFESA